MPRLKVRAQNEEKNWSKNTPMKSDVLFGFATIGEELTATEPKPHSPVSWRKARTLESYASSMLQQG